MLYTARQFDAAEKYLEVYERVNGYSWSTSRAVLTMTRESPPIAAPLVEKALQTFPNDVRFVASAIPQLARNGAWEDADSQLENLQRVDRDGMWAYAAKVELAVMRGDYAADAGLLRTALADERSTDLLRGTVLFMQGDVDGGAAAWRAMPPNLKLQASGDAPWLETMYPSSVPVDARYQALLDELGIGAKWSAYMRERVHELAPVTGIEASNPTEDSCGCARAVIRRADQKTAIRASTRRKLHRQRQEIGTPDVSVRIRKFTERRIFVGEVVDPGTDRQLTLPAVAHIQVLDEARPVVEVSTLRDVRLRLAVSPCPKRRVSSKKLKP